LNGAFLAGDWGTTRLRAWVVSEQNQVLCQQNFPFGVGSLASGEAERLFREVVRPSLQASELPALLCGMVGSNLGWFDAGYVDCPADPEVLALQLASPAALVRIVPGLRCAGLTGAPDVMRGEETQVFGWLLGAPDRSDGRTTLCHPGTHAKWIAVEAGRIDRFVTAMTGELFAVLSRHSVLRSEQPPRDQTAFDAGVDAAGEGDALAARLFSVRSRVVGGGADPASSSSYLSGLLIGAEAAALIGRLGLSRDEVIDLVGDTVLCGWYARALGRLGHASRSHDGEPSALRGLIAIYRKAAA
jgi:2-dehydro-3-deoxygalactonokinase